MKISYKKLVMGMLIIVCYKQLLFLVDDFSIHSCNYIINILYIFIDQLHITKFVRALKTFKNRIS